MTQRELIRLIHPGIRLIILNREHLLPKQYIMSDKKNKRLQELRGSDFEIAKGQPDIRGWEVRDAEGRLIGKVRELIFDARDHKVRYMVVDVKDSKELELENRSVLVPIGLAELEPRHDDVILPKVTPFQLRALPRYNKEDLGTRAEKAVSTVFGRNTDKYADDADLGAGFYDNEDFNEDNMYRQRKNIAGKYTSEQKPRDLDREEERRLRSERHLKEEEIGTPISYVDPVEAERLHAARLREERNAEQADEIRRERERRDGLSGRNLED
jgi:hypothetical protein